MHPTMTDLARWVQAGVIPPYGIGSLDLSPDQTAQRAANRAVAMGWVLPSRQNSIFAAASDGSEIADASSTCLRLSPMRRSNSSILMMRNE